MDMFGIGSAMRLAAQLFFQMSRHTGRTTLLVDSVKDGDRIVFCDPKERDHVDRLLKEREVKVTCIVVPPQDAARLFGDYGTSEGRTIFDHSWVEKFYMQALDRAEKEIDHLERETSGYGAAHRETARKFRELRRPDRWFDPD